jgi:hypothetical protein
MSVRAAKLPPTDRFFQALPVCPGIFEYFCGSVPVIETFFYLLEFGQNEKANKDMFATFGFMSINMLIMYCRPFNLTGWFSNVNNFA